MAILHVRPVVFLFLLLVTAPLSTKGQHLACDQRRIEGHSPIKQGGDGGFKIGVVGPLASRGLYAPNEVYTVTVQGLNTRYSTQKFTEFLLVSESEKQAMMGASGLVTTGLFHIMDEAQTRFSEVCPDGVTSVNRQPKAEVRVLWTAPSVLVASCITFKVTVVERPHVWFMDDGQLTTTLCPVSSGGGEVSRTTTSPPTTTTATSTTSSPSPSICCACDDAKYDVSFEGIWSKETHPKDFPENAWLVHFSDIIGASHSPNLTVYREGFPASEGIRQVAEWGSTRQLETELKAQASLINTIIKARGLWHPNERGTSSAAFRVDRDRPLVSLVSMLGPSPDWIVGISSLRLCLSNCTWLPEISIDLFPLDAGTDSGVTYMSPNSPSNVSAPITLLTPTQPNDARSPFHGLERMDPFAKVVIRRQRIYPIECSDTPRPSTLFLTENSEDDIDRPECAVLEWSSWSECSVRCGKGLRMRKRNYAIPMKADMFRCDRQLVEKEMCLGSQSTCSPDESDNSDHHLHLCALTPWSEFSPCSTTCGEGIRTRTRRYKNHMGRKKCGPGELSSTEKCISSIPCPHTTTSVAGLLPPAQPDCPISPWSEFSPCSVSCGIGIRLRSRFFLLPNSNNPNCSETSYFLREAEDCVGEYGGECTIRKEDAEQICALHPDQGPCRDNHLRFYFHPEKEMCLPFTYGGCKGNRNRFETEGECQDVCGFLTRTSSSPQHELQIITPNKVGITRRPIILSTTFTTSPLPRRILPWSVNSMEEEPHTTTTKTTFSPSGMLESEESLNLDLGAAAAVVEVKSTPTASSLFPFVVEDDVVDCVVSAWSGWTSCVESSGGSGGGYRSRTRTILLQPSPQGRRCPRKLLKRKSCIPVHGLST